jgi:hypothetical protein
MKAYLATTGTIFALLAIMHLNQAIQDRDTLSTHPVEFFSMAFLGLLAATLSVWAWKLFRKRTS